MDGVCVKGIVESFDGEDGVLAAFLEDDGDARNGREPSLGGCGAQLTWLWAGGDSYKNESGWCRTFLDEMEGVTRVDWIYGGKDSLYTASHDAQGR